MTTVDQRILISAPPDVVWRLISNIENNARWQANCHDIAFLTSRRAGPGVRWRCTVQRGFDYVVETTAWYDGLGYEYVLVDGVPYSENRGRLRLQEIAEGTIVQWSFSYEMSGLIGGLRNSLSLRRQLENEIADSLRNLWRYVRDEAGEQPHEAKSLMRDAIEYEERSRYQPRHAPTTAGDDRFRPPQPASGVHLDEPPVEEDDTRPNPAVAAPSPPAAYADEPDFLVGADLDAVPESATPSEVPPPEPEITAAQAPEPPAAEPQPVSESPGDNQPPDPPQPDTTSEPQPSTVERSIPDTSSMDTAQVSIWEVFGLPRPSETQEMRAVSPPEEAPSATGETVPPAEPVPPPLEAPVEQPEAVPAEPDPVPQPRAEPASPVIASQEHRKVSVAPSPAFTGYRIKKRRNLARLRRRVGG